MTTKCRGVCFLLTLYMVKSNIHLPTNSVGKSVNYLSESVGNGSAGKVLAKTAIKLSSNAEKKK